MKNIPQISKFMNIHIYIERDTHTHTVMVSCKSVGMCKNVQSH